MRKLIDWGNSFSIGNRGRTLWQEIGMQTIEQIAHFAVAFAITVTASWIGGLIGFALFALGAGYIGFREGTQYPSSRWYDQPLDVLFFLMGAIGGYTVVN